MFVNNFINITPSCQAANINCRLISTLSPSGVNCFVNTPLLPSDFQSSSRFRRNRYPEHFVRQGLGREPQQEEKYTRSVSAARVIFRVCGNKGIACTVALVYTQALLAPLQLVCNIAFELFPRILMGNKIKRTLLSGYVIVANDIVTIQIAYFTQPSGQFYQGLIGCICKLARFVRVADFDGNGILVSVIAGGGFFMQRNTLNDLAF